MLFPSLLVCNTSSYENLAFYFGGQLFDVERTRAFNLVEGRVITCELGMGPTRGRIICIGLVGWQMSSLKTHDTGVNVIALSKSNNALTLEQWWYNSIQYSKRQPPYISKNLF
eukprot:Gb_09790 [translate_table: standard]